MSELKIVGLNLDISWKEKKENLKKIEAELISIDADIILLPEMFSTGFCMDAIEIADYNQETLEWMKKLSHQKNAAVAGSVSVAENKKFYNRFYFVYPNGEYEYYDKRHLFSYSGEDKIYTSGNTRKVVNYKGFRILLQICFDLRFPVFSRNQNDYDAVLYVANWPSKRVDAWRSLLKARAIENQCYTFGLNRIGKDGNNLEYPESTLVFFADGTEISKRKDNLIIANWNINDLINFKSKFPFLENGDNFTLNLG